jgi:hypothetical protein
VNEIEEETREFIEERIRAIKAELSKYPMPKRRAFDRACFLKPTLETDDKLFLMFLRAERFDEVAAARKLCLHFDHKMELFGEAKLPKTITLEDLDDDDLAVFKTGSYIILPKKDRSGRQPQLLNLPRMSFKNWKNQVRHQVSIRIIRMEGAESLIILFFSSLGPVYVVQYVQCVAC